MKLLNFVSVLYVREDAENCGALNFVSEVYVREDTGYC